MVGIAFVLFTLAGGMFLSRVAQAVFGKLRWNDPQLFGIEELSVTAVLGFGLAIAGALALYLNQRVQAASTSPPS